MEKVVQHFYDLFMEYYKKFVESPFEMFLAALKILTFVKSFYLKSTLLLYQSFLISKHVRYDFSNYFQEKYFPFITLHEQISKNIEQLLKVMIISIFELNILFHTVYSSAHESELSFDGVNFSSELSKVKSNKRFLDINLSAQKIQEITVNSSAKTIFVYTDN